ncbi:hypothetical protein B0A55_02070 [Friedmanniomyces simplex]|uniref:Uncharacterized protein n=1 Tax=Friedmanniomyces simplex TaxID=329884 RepID=A0A4V6WLB3_9PEZI|nr:hypothetical protein B0A55_02070 [Friedmanniomyces simplex]
MSIPPLISGPFGTLPGEIRNTIYDNVLSSEIAQTEDKGGIQHVRGSRMKHHRHRLWRAPSLLQVCSQIRKETLTIYFKTTSLNIHVDLDNVEDVKRVAKWLGQTTEVAQIDPDHLSDKAIRLHLYQVHWRNIYNFFPIAQLLRSSRLRAGVLTPSDMEFDGGIYRKDTRVLFDQQVQAGNTFVILLGSRHYLLNAFQKLLDLGEAAAQQGVTEQQLQISIEDCVKALLLTSAGKRSTRMFRKNGDGLTFGERLPKVHRQKVPVHVPAPEPQPLSVCAFVAHSTGQDSLATAFEFAQHAGFPATMAEFKRLALNHVVQLPLPMTPSTFTQAAHPMQYFTGYLSSDFGTRAPAVFLSSNSPQVTVNGELVNLSAGFTLQDRAPSTGNPLLGTHSSSSGSAPQPLTPAQVSAAAAYSASWVFPEGYVSVHPVSSHASSSTIAAPPSVSVNPADTYVLLGSTVSQASLSGANSHSRNNQSGLDRSELQVLNPLAFAVDDADMHDPGPDVDSFDLGGFDLGAFDGGMSGPGVDMFDLLDFNGGMGGGDH